MSSDIDMESSPAINSGLSLSKKFSTSESGSILRSLCSTSRRVLVFVTLSSWEETEHDAKFYLEFITVWFIGVVTPLASRDWSIGGLIPVSTVFMFEPNVTVGVCCKVLVLVP